MQKLHTSIFINAPVEKVWDTMLGEKTYPEWTKAFSPAPTFQSTFQGDWSEGSKMLFTATDESGENMGGMVSRIAENRPYEYLSIEHVGMLKEDGTEDYTSDEVKKWAPAFENYTFVAKDGGTEVTIDQDMDDEYASQFNEMWGVALQTLKELAEKD